MKYYISPKIVKGEGLLNSVIDKLPFELHLPGYNYCGPGTKLQKRLERGDRGINGLDESCKEHDIAYSNEKHLPNRHMADKKLLKNALTRLTSKDASWKEKLAAIGVSAAMNTKLKLGMGNRIRKTNKINVTPKNNQSSNENQKRNIVHQSATIMQKSMKVMENYLQKMEKLVARMTYGRIKTNNKPCQLGNCKKTQKNNHKTEKEVVEKKHFDNYHEKNIKQKMSTAANAFPQQAKKRKIAPNKSMYNDSGKKRKLLDKEIEEEISRSSLPIKKATKRKLTFDTEDTDEVQGSKQVKIDTNPLLQLQKKRKLSDSEDDEDNYPSKSPRKS